MCVAVVTAASAEVISFDKEQPGSLPPGWTSAMTKTGGAPRWEIKADNSAPSKPNVLAQLSEDRTSGRFPLAIYDKATFRDGEVSVRFKPISGRTDQAAGLVWRYRDSHNYYIVRANALENNVVMYKVEGGTRTSLAPKGAASNTYGVKHPVPKQTWSELRASFQGNTATIYLNGQTLFTVEDATFSGTGKVGLWTKADSVTYFDDFRFSGK